MVSVCKTKPEWKVKMGGTGLLVLLGGWNKCPICCTLCVGLGSCVSVIQLKTRTDSRANKHVTIASSPTVLCNLNLYNDVNCGWKKIFLNKVHNMFLMSLRQNRYLPLCIPGFILTIGFCDNQTKKSLIIGLASLLYACINIVYSIGLFH